MARIIDLPGCENEAAGPLLTLRDVAERLNFSEAAVRKLIQRGELSGFKIGNRFRISPQDLAEYLDQQRVVTPSARDWSDFRLSRSS